MFGKKFSVEFEAFRLIENAIPQYELGHLEKIKRIKQLSPKNITLLGKYMYGVSLIEIVLKSKEQAKNIMS